LVFDPFAFSLPPSNKISTESEISHTLDFDQMYIGLNHACGSVSSVKALSVVGHQGVDHLDVAVGGLVMADAGADFRGGITAIE